MKGYLMLSSENWCRNIKDLRTDTAVFWRKRTTFKAIDIGEYVYFMTGKLSSKGRCIVGRGKLRETTSMNASDAWLRYGSQMGYYEKQEFTASVSMMYGLEDIPLGCLVLDNVEFLDTSIPIASYGIVYRNGTVSGKTLNEEECKRISQSFKEG